MTEIFDVFGLSGYGIPLKHLPEIMDEDLF